MFKFEFHDPDTEITTHQLLGNHHTLTEVVEAFQQFLLGAGYSFPKGVCLGFEEEDGELEEDDAGVRWVTSRELAEMFPPETHTCNNGCCATPEAPQSDRCPHDPVTCRGKELGTCGSCVFTKPENCT
jgi:hypothetical protein